MRLSAASCASGKGVTIRQFVARISTDGYLRYRPVLCLVSPLLTREGLAGMNVHLVS